MVSLDFLKDLDLSAIALPEDKFEECMFFFCLMSVEIHRDKFRWLPSAFLNASYSYLEIKAKSLHFSIFDPDTGEPVEDSAGLDVLKRYVRTFQDKKNPEFVKTSAFDTLLKSLYEIRKANTHNYSLSIMKRGDNLPKDFVIGDRIGSGTPALELSEQVMAFFTQLEKELEET